MTDRLTPKEELVLLAKDLGIHFPNPTPFTLDYNRLLLHSIKKWMKDNYKAFPTAEMREWDGRTFFCAKIESKYGSVIWGEFNSFDTAYLSASIDALKAVKETSEWNQAAFRPTLYD